MTEVTSARTRNLVLPGVAGLLLNAINFYEVGLNMVRFMGPPVGDALFAVSQQYLDSGLLGLAVMSVALGLVATKYWMAWVAFYMPACLARVITGTVLFTRGDANMWPIFFVGDVVLALGSLAVFWAAGKLKAKARQAQQPG